jgi:Tol biopolymer transport system component
MALVLLAVVALVGIMAGSGAAAPGDTTLVSDDGCCAQGDGESSSASVSADGRYVAFASTSSLGASGGVSHIYVRDRQTGLNELISVNSNEVPGSGSFQGSLAPSISDNGRYVVFESSMTNLVPGDTNAKPDIFIRDRQLGTTERVSVNSNEAQGLEGGQVPPEPGGRPAAVSDDGNIVAFHSAFTNMVGGDTNGKPDIFVRNRQAGTTQRISVDNEGRELGRENPQTGVRSPYQASKFPSISGDGRFVAYQTDAVQLTGGAIGMYGVVVRDRQAGTNDLVSVNTNETSANATNGFPSISSDGRYVAFQSEATNLNTLAAGGDTNGKSDIYLRDRTAGTTERVSVDSNEAQATGGSTTIGSTAPSINSDGRLVAFQSDATNLVAGDTNGKPDIFVRDRTAGTTMRASVTSSGEQAPSTSMGAEIPSMSSNGNVVAFESNAALVASDTNQMKDIFVHELPAAPADTTPPTVTSVSPANKATGVAAATNLSATFSEAMRPASINTNTFTLNQMVTNPDGTITRVPVAASVSYEAATRQATLDPNADLSAGARYEAKVKPGAKDLAGNSLDQNPTLAGNQPKVWRFTISP